MRGGVPLWRTCVAKKKRKESDIAILQEAIVLDQSKGKQSVLQCKFFCPLCSYVKYSTTELKPTTLPGGVKGLLSLSLHSNLRSLQVSQQESQRVFFFFFRFLVFLTRRYKRTGLKEDLEHWLFVDDVYSQLAKSNTTANKRALRRGVSQFSGE